MTGMGTARVRDGFECREFAPADQPRAQGVYGPHWFFGDIRRPPRECVLRSFRAGGEHHDLCDARERGEAVPMHRRQFGNASRQTTQGTLLDTRERGGGRAERFACVLGVKPAIELGVRVHDLPRGGTERGGIANDARVAEELERCVVEVG